MHKLLLVIFFVVVQGSPVHATPQSFREAKNMVREVYNDHPETLYCGCKISWYKSTGSSGMVDFEECHYQVRKNTNRAKRDEVEHIFPAHAIGSQRQCWQQGGRANCTANDSMYSIMEADLHNLAPAIGEVNGDRSNYKFGMVTSAVGQYGNCQMKVDFKQRIAEPPNNVKGMVARVYFYMSDRYNISLSQQQQKLLMVWDKQFQPNNWELERDRRIAHLIGHNNPFVTREKTWKLGVKLAGIDLVENKEVFNQSIIGNKNSRKYHLPEGCPSYDRVSPRNRINFLTEQDAYDNGFIKAGNCR